MPQRLSLKNYLFPVLLGLLAGAGAITVMMLAAAFAAVKLALSLSFYRTLVWIPVLCGGFAAGAASGAATPSGEKKLLAGLSSGLLIWLILAVLTREPAPGELLRGGVLLFSGTAGAGLTAGKRQHIKPGKAYPRRLPRRRPF